MNSALYSLRTDGDQYRITKFVDGNPEGSYLTSETECECPAGHRHTCRHRQMLPQMIAHGIANTHYFMAYGAGGAIVDFNGTPKKLFDELAAVVEPASRPAEQDTMSPLPEGVQMFGIDDLLGIHNAIADAVGEPEAKLAVPEGQHSEESEVKSWRRF